MCPLIVSISSLHLSGQEARLPGIYHHPELCWWGKCLRGTEKLIKINLAFTFSTWCLRRHCRGGHGNGWTSCPLFFIISLCLRCLYVQWQEWSEEGLAQWPWSSQWAAPCGRTGWTTLQAEPHFLSPFLAEASLKKGERKQEHKGWYRQPSAPLCPQITHTSYLVSFNPDRQPYFTFSFCALCEFNYRNSVLFSSSVNSLLWLKLCGHRPRCKILDNERGKTWTLPERKQQTGLLRLSPLFPRK